MNKVSALFLIILGAIALLALYQALFPISSTIAIVRFLGLSAFFLLCISTMIGPLAVLWPKTYVVLIEPRRAVGISVFVFALAHYLLVAALYFNFDFPLLASFLPNQLGFAGFAILLLLAATANDWAVKSLGSQNWKRLQQLVYVAFLFIFAHFLLVAQGNAEHTGSGYDLAQLGLIALGIITIALQLAGFYVRRRGRAPF